MLVFFSNFFQPKSNNSRTYLIIEIKSALESLGIKSSDAEIEGLFIQVDADKSGMNFFGS